MAGSYTCRSLVQILLSVAITRLVTVTAQSNITINHNATAGSQGLGAAATVRSKAAGSVTHHQLLTPTAVLAEPVCLLPNEC